MSFIDFAYTLGKRESDNDYTAVHGSMLGRWQFSRLRLVDLGIMERCSDSASGFSWVRPWTRNRFLSNLDKIQDRVFRHHVLDYIVRIAVSRPELTWYHKVAGLVAVAHLVGYSAMVKWEASSPDERESIRDGLGTTASEYYDLCKDIDISDIRANVNLSQ